MEPPLPKVWKVKTRACFGTSMHTLIWNLKKIGTFKMWNFPDKCGTFIWNFCFFWSLCALMWGLLLAPKCGTFVLTLISKIYLKGSLYGNFGPLCFDCRTLMWNLCLEPWSLQPLCGNLTYNFLSGTFNLHVGLFLEPLCGSFVGPLITFRNALSGLRSAAQATLSHPKPSQAFSLRKTPKQPK